MRNLAAIALALGLAGTGGAFAQDGDPLAYYDAYLAAVQAGEYQQASEQGEAAWRAAEQSWGDDGDTGLLAFTIAQFRTTIADRAGALEPARRAVELAPLTQEYTADEARLLLGSALASSEPDTAREHLEAALQGLQGAAPRDDIVRGKLDLAMLRMAESPESAVALAAEAVQDSRAAGSVNIRTHLAELGQVQYLAGQFQPAMGSLSESLNLWEEQAPGEMPAALANTIAWHTVTARALARSAPEGAPPPGGRGGPGMFGGPNALAFFNFYPKRDCNIEWEDVAPATFPAPDGDTATIGGVVVMYDIDESGAAVNPRIVGSAPNAPHHEQFIMDRITEQKARRFVREPCRIGRITTFTYDF